MVDAKLFASNSSCVRLYLLLPLGTFREKDWEDGEVMGRVVQSCHKNRLKLEYLCFEKI